jgi:hypothetical protein
MKRFNTVVCSVVAALAVVSFDLAFGVGTAFAADPPQLRIEFEPRAAIIRGVNPHGDVLVYSLHRRQVDFQNAHTSVWQLTATDTTGGTVRVTTPTEIEPDRLWVIVDQATGRSVITRTADSASVDRFPPGLLKKDADAGGEALTVPLQAAYLLVVRPGEDAWLTAVGDGGAADDDGALNNSVHVRPGKLDDYRRTGKKTDKFRKDDLLIAIEPVTLRVMEERLK